MNVLTEAMAMQVEIDTLNGPSESVTTAKQSASQAVDADGSMPTTPRELAQLRQLVRSLVCVHPQKDLVLKMLHSDGYIEYCPHCMRVTDIWEA
jgi:hypothetical protein